MTAVISFPINNGGYEFAKIYRANSVFGTYSLIDTVNARQCEYEDPAGDYASCYKVAFSDGNTDQSQIAVRSLIQQVIDTIRVDCQISVTAFPDADIYYLFDSCKTEMMVDICTFYYGIQINKLTETIYQLPNRYFFDKNCGGVVSVLDFEFFKQATPIYIYSEKTPVTVVYVDPEERYVELAAPLNSNEVLKVNYYSIGRRIKHQLLIKLLAYKLCTTYYETPSTENSIAQDSQIKIGDITIKTGSSSSSSSSSNADLAIKMNAKYKQLITNLKTGFYRTN